MSEAGTSQNNTILNLREGGTNLGALYTETSNTTQNNRSFNIQVVKGSPIDRDIRF